MKDTRSTWDPGSRTLRSALKGAVSVEDVEAWKRSLRAALALVPAGTTFKLMYDLHGYEPASIEAHKAMREVVPLLLAETGMRPAVVDLFDEKPHVEVAAAPRVRCVAFANLHHDPEKMGRYQAKIAKANQRFFSDPAAAAVWLNDQPL
ncbi:MAG: hypothetical protein U1E56_03205 [Bauldia sp.]